VDRIEGMTDEPTRPRRKVGRRATQTPTGKVGKAAGTELTTTDDSSGDSFTVEIDPREDKVAELQVSALFLVGIVALIGFCVAYFAISIHDKLGQYSNWALGGTLAIALSAMGAGMIVWAKKLLPHEQAIQDRHDFHSPPEEELAAEDTFLAGANDLGLGKRKILRRTLIGALGLFPLPLVILLRDLGTLPGAGLLPRGAATGWKTGDRLVDLDTRLPVKLGDLAIGGIQTVMPEGFSSAEDMALAPTMLIRFADGQIQSTKEANWGVNGHVAYSKICTHAGCPISLYEQQTHNLLCPCHQSTFDMARDAKVIFGPAARPLPQLRIAVDAQGYLYAVGPYSQAVGPSFWERR
jgi:ubiquinol-cytochrome c reductase iron-sulfur subunit